jgi:hypothetical protein
VRVITHQGGWCCVSVSVGPFACFSLCLWRKREVTHCHHFISIDIYRYNLILISNQNIKIQIIEFLLLLFFSNINLYSFQDFKNPTS